MSNDHEPKYFTLKDWLLFFLISVGFSINHFGFTWAALFATWGITIVIFFVVVINSFCG